MNKSILLARMNLRRARGQGAAIVVLMLLAAMMLNLWLILATDYRQNFDRPHSPRITPSFRYRIRLPRLAERISWVEECLDETKRNNSRQ